MSDKIKLNRNKVCSNENKIKTQSIVHKSSMKYVKTNKFLPLREEREGERGRWKHGNEREIKT